MPGDETPANQLIYKLKRENRRDVVGYIADELTESIRESLKVDENTIFTCVPRRRRARIKYGIDHAQNLGRAVAKNFGADFQMLLRSKSKNAQKKSKSREERLKNAQFVLLNEDLDLSGKTVVIIDDIVTTGASLGAAALNVKSLAPKKIIGASIAIAYKDAYTPLSTSDRFKNK